MTIRGDDPSATRSDEPPNDPFADGVTPRAIVDDLRRRRSAQNATRIAKPGPRVATIGPPPALDGRKAQPDKPSLARTRAARSRPTSRTSDIQAPVREPVSAPRRREDEREKTAQRVRSQEAEERGRIEAEAEQFAEREREAAEREAARASAEMERLAREKARDSVREWHASQEVRSRSSSDEEIVSSYEYPASHTHQSIETYVPETQGNMPAPFRERAPAKNEKDGKKSGLPVFLIWGFFIFTFFALNLCDST